MDEYNLSIYDLEEGKKYQCDYGQTANLVFRLHNKVLEYKNDNLPLWAKEGGDFCSIQSKRFKEVKQKKKYTMYRHWWINGVGDLKYTDSLEKTRETHPSTKHLETEIIKEFEVEDE